jgi:hypothetical protein
LRISQTVDAAILMPRAASSPWMRLYPQLGFSRVRRRMRALMVRTVGGRPRCFGRDAFACRWRRKSRVPAEDGVGGDDQVQLPQRRPL